MVDVYLQKNKPFNGEDIIAVVITGSESQRHAGLYYNTGLTSENHFLHLGFHYELIRELPKDRHCWLSLAGIENDERQIIAQWLDSIWNSNRERIPYGINYSNSRHFNNDGAFCSATDDGGLTCATFILASFADLGFQIIDVASSYGRQCDAAWHQHILDALTPRVPPEYIAKQSVFLGQSARYRPEEVAGAAATYSDNPIQFVDAIELGKTVLSTMRSLNALVP